MTSTCRRETTSWSACSVSCGMGVSVRVTNDNADCRPHKQRRLCLVRPCELDDKHFVSIPQCNGLGGSCLQHMTSLTSPRVKHTALTKVHIPQTLRNDPTMQIVRRKSSATYGVNNQSFNVDLRDQEILH